MLLIYSLLKDVLYPKTFGQGEEGPFKYCISERIKGSVVADLQAKQKIELLPDLVRVITDMNQIQLDSTTTGFGPLIPSGNGAYDAWESFIKAFYEENQTGTFWENWHELFRTSCLERDVFNEIYARLLTFSKYNSPHRYFVHGDCHEWNILSDGRSITGIIDGNCMYGDFLIDIATVEGAIPDKDVAQAFRIHYEKKESPISCFNERLIGARYFKGLDGLRFFAKMGWDHAYVELRDRLLSMTH